jgi:flagellin-specific chaperone FliS
MEFLNKLEVSMIVKDRLTIIVYRGVIKFILQAIVAQENGHTLAKARHINKPVGKITELN